MHHATHETDHPRQQDREAADFPHAPISWSPTLAEELAGREGLTLEPDHWEALRSMQTYHAATETPKVRELLDALEERFHGRGGLKYLYTLFPGGPVAQGYRLAGLPVPPGAQDSSFGSVQ